MMRSRHLRSKQRGSALILAVFILFAMLALGMLAMRTATQSVSGSGNVRLAKQAYYVAEVGLYHAIALMNLEAPRMLPRRDSAAMERSKLVVMSPKASPPEARATVRFVNRDDADVPPDAQFTAPNVWEGPNPLGIFGTASGFLPSYQVEVSGFKPWACPPGYDPASLAESGQGCCLMHFQARGLVARTEHPTEEELDSVDGINRYAEHVLRAGVVIGPMNLRGCSP